MLLEQRGAKLEETKTQFKNVLGMYGNDLLGLVNLTGQSVMTEVVKILTPMSTFYNRFTKKLPGDVLI